MLKSMPAEQAEETRSDLEHLHEELKKPKPSREWYSVSLEGLIKAAENVGKVGAPVIELAGKLLKILYATASSCVTIPMKPCPPIA